MFNPKGVLVLLFPKVLPGGAPKGVVLGAPKGLVGALVLPNTLGVAD